MSAAKVIAELKAQADPKQAALLQGFFRTGKGEYGEGDRFLGVMVPQTRKVALRHRDLPLSQVAVLLRSPIHEVRFAAVAILVRRAERGDEKTRREVFDFYLKHRGRMNNWDLVDVSAGKIVGEWLVGRDRSLLCRLAKSRVLWDRRIAVVASGAFIRRGDSADTLKLAEMLLNDPHDLIHKAVGWMLREVGKKNLPDLIGFLDRYADRMPRVMLSYATEKLSPGRRTIYVTARKKAAA